MTEHPVASDDMLEISKHINDETKVMQLYIINSNVSKFIDDMVCGTIRNDILNAYKIAIILAAVIVLFGAEAVSKYLRNDIVLGVFIGACVGIYYYLKSVTLEKKYPTPRPTSKNAN